MNNCLDLFNTVPYRYFYIEDFEEPDTSLMVVICHHAFTDVVQYFTLLSITTDNYNKDKMIKVKGLPAWKLALGRIMAPFYMLRMGLEIVTAPTAKNVFIQPKPETMNRNVAISKYHDRAKF